MPNNFEIQIDADAFVPDASNHPGRGLEQGRPFWAFDDSTVETLRSKSFVWPDSYTGSGTLKADIAYKMASATTGSIDLEVSVEAVTDGDHDLDSGEFFGTVNAANEAVPGTAGNHSTLTITLSNKDSVASGDLVRFKLERDADDGTNDTATGDLHILSVRIYEVSA